LLDDADLGHALIDGAFVWRAIVRGMQGENTRVINLESGPKYTFADCPIASCDWSAESFAALKRLTEEVSQGDGRSYSPQIPMLDSAKPLEDEQETAKDWVDLAQASPSPEVYESGLAAKLRETGCDASGAPYVIRGLTRSLFAEHNPRFAGDSPHRAELAAAFLDGARCAGARGLSEEDKVVLRAIRDPAPPDPARAAPKQ
jgi:hypothetical protein